MTATAAPARPVPLPAQGMAAFRAAMGKIEFAQLEAIRPSVDNIFLSAGAIEGSLKTAASSIAQGREILLELRPLQTRLGAMLLADSNALLGLSAHALDVVGRDSRAVLRLVQEAHTAAQHSLSGYLQLLEINPS